jgi:hypothetical protein
VVRIAAGRRRLTRCWTGAAEGSLLSFYQCDAAARSTRSLDVLNRTTMKAEIRKPEEKPSATECPKQFCFFWVEKGARFADGLYDSLQEAINHAVFVQDDFCRCTFGVCNRLALKNAERDWYEPNEVELAKAGLPWFYFIPTPEKLDGESQEEYIQGSELLWGVEHWRR